MTEYLGEFELNKIYCMDCLEGLKRIPDNSVDLVLTDPPYNTGMGSKVTSPDNHPTVRFSSNSTKKPWLFGFFNDNISKEDYDKLVTSCCNEFYRILKDDKCAYIYINWKMLGLWLDRLSGVGFNIKNVIVWDKRVHGLNYQNYAYTYELIIYAVKGMFKLNNKRCNDLRDGTFKDVWNIQRKISTSTEEGHHETEKLMKVVNIPIIHASKEGDIVLDAFVGSGTTAVACKQLGRKFIGFEISPEYCKIAEKRLAQEVLF